MPVVVDPDNIDRDQAIFGTVSQKTSLYPVGAKIHANASSATATTSVGTNTFHDTNGNFVTWGISAGDILALYNGSEAGHLVVSAVTSATALEMVTDDGFTQFSDSSSLVYTIRSPSGGSIADGVTKQALYSFGKEEWRVDSRATALTDNLIRHEFPDEAITSEQFEIGGGTSHADWDYFNNYTRKKVRTAGWSEKNTAASTISEKAGIITLGPAESDAQIYYQQVSAQNAPVNFTFLGAINEAIEVYSSGAGAATPTDYRTYLKLFLRKKFFTFGGSQISDIGVTTINTIVNRFPLTHVADGAITDTDAKVIGAAPFHSAASVITDTDGITASVSATRGTFRDPNRTAALNAFTSAVVPGDSVFVTGVQTDAGYFTVVSVQNASTLSVDTTENGVLTGATGLDYDILTRIRYAIKSGGTISDSQDLAIAAGASAAVALASSATANFITDGVVAGDFLAATSATSDHEGVYEIVSVVSENTLQVDATDNPFTTVTGIDFKIYTPSMFLQYKNEAISIATTASVVFASTTNRATRTSGSWTGDGLTAGSILAFSSTASNNKSFTVASAGVATVQFVSTDSSRITNETVATPIVTAHDGFKRTISNVVYGFDWKLLANTNTLINCYQFHQHQMVQPIDINWGELPFRGDVNDLLLTFATPTGKTANMYIDKLHADDTNNITLVDATGISRLQPFVSSFTIAFNNNLQNDSSAIYRMFYTTNPSGNFSTDNAQTVKDSLGAEVAGNVGGSASLNFTYDYDGNADGGRTPGTDVAFTLVAIGLDTAQYVILTGTITRAKGLSFSMVAPIERNYSNPA